MVEVERSEVGLEHQNGTFFGACFDRFGQVRGLLDVEKIRERKDIVLPLPLRFPVLVCREASGVLGHKNKCDAPKKLGTSHLWFRSTSRCGC